MPIDSFAPEYFDQQPSPLEMFDHPWMAIAGRRSLSGPGNALSWPDLEGSVVSQSYTDGQVPMIYGCERRINDRTRAQVNLVFGQ